MKNNTVTDEILKITSLLRTCVDTENIALAIYLLGEVQKECPETHNTSLLCSKMWNILNTLGMSSPFKNDNVFLELCEFLTVNVDYELMMYICRQKLSRSSGQWNMITALAEEFLKNIKEGGASLLISEGDKFFPYLKKIVETKKYNEYTITVEKVFEYEIIKKIFEKYSNVKVLKTSIYEYEFSNKKFDTILSIPDMGRRLQYNSRTSFLCKETDLAATENLLLHLSDTGTLVTVLPSRITFSGGNVRKFREFIKDSYSLREINELPTGILTNISIKTVMLIISTGKTDDIVVKKYIFSNDTKQNRLSDSLELKVDDEVLVMKDELEEQDDWNIERFFSSHDEDWNKYQSSMIKKVPLYEVAEIYRGKAVTQKDPNGSIGVINISDLLQYDIDYSNLDHFDETERKISNYLLYSGDVLLTARGTAIRSALFRKQPYPCIASANLIVIRPKPNKLSSTYLKLFLDSAIGKKLIKTMQQGTVVMNLNAKDLENVEIPYLPYDEQKKVEEKYCKGLQKYQQAIKIAEKEWQNTIIELEQNF